MYCVLGLLGVSGLLILNLAYENLGVIEQELGEFAGHYKQTSTWWFTSLFAVIISLSIGASPGVFVDILVLSIFILPGALHFVKYYPFGISCNYRSFDRSTGQTNLSEEEENIVHPEGDGIYEIELVVETGSNVKEFSLDLSEPDGVEEAGIQALGNDIELTSECVLKGEAAPIEDSFVVTVFFEETSGVGPNGDVLVIEDESSGRIIETVRFLPN